jgi:hypothetical protein
MVERMPDRAAPYDTLQIKSRNHVGLIRLASLVGVLWLAVPGVTTAQSDDGQWLRARVAADIEAFLTRPGSEAPVRAFLPPAVPPGSPIGDPALDWLRTSETVCEVELYSGF